MTSHVQHMLGIAHYLAIIFPGLLVSSFLWAEPSSYLIYCALFGILFYLLTILAWYRNSAVLGALPIIVLPTALSVINKHYFGNDITFQAVQGLLVVFTTFSLILLLTRNWLSVALNNR